MCISLCVGFLLYCYQLYTVCFNFICCCQDYPFKAHGRHPLEYIRHYPHLRPKTREFSSLLRIRNAATMAVHDFFQVETCVCHVYVSMYIVIQRQGYLLIHTPIITSCDCEGAGEMFTVSVS